MRYGRKDDRHFARLVLTGRFTSQDADIMRRLIAEVKSGPPRHILIDLTEVEFIDSAGIGMLLVFNGEASSAGAALALLAPTPGGQARKVLDLTRIGMIVPLFETLDAYIAACVPEAALAPPNPCAAGENPLAVAARALKGAG